MLKSFQNNKNILKRVNNIGSNLSILKLKIGDYVKIYYTIGIRTFIFQGVCISKKGLGLTNNFTLTLFRDYGFSLGVFITISIFFNQGWNLIITKKNKNFNVSKPFKRWGYQLSRKRLKK